MVAFGRHRGELHCRESSGHSSCSCETHGTCCSFFWNRWNRCCIILIIRLLFNIVVHLVAKIVMKTSNKQTEHHDRQKTNQTSWCTSQTTTSWDRQCYTISLGAVRWQQVKQKVRVAYAMIIKKLFIVFNWQKGLFKPKPWETSKWKTYYPRSMCSDATTICNWLHCHMSYLTSCLNTLR